jgi:response regulator RpfG family c-di-GMP phosphodiesterase
MANKVLVIDGGNRDPDSFRTELDSSAYELVPARGVEEARKILETEKIDLIMINETSDGFENDPGVNFINFLKKDRRFKNIPLIFSDTIGMDGFSLDVSKSGESLPVDKFLRKPAEPGEIIETIRDLLK